MSSVDAINQSSFEVITETERDALQVEMLQNGTSNHELERLCGFLQKLGNRGLVKQYKTRWFVYGNDNCRLYYYRTPVDVLPLGEICIENATLSFEIGTNSRPGGFLIRTPERSYNLDAGNKQTMIYWLQELQKRRRAYSALITQRSHGSLTLRNIKAPEQGLISQAKTGRDVCCTDDDDVTSIFSPVCLNDVNVGEKNAHLHRTTLPAVSWANWKTELRNTFSQLRGLKNTEPAQTTPTPGLTADDCQRQMADTPTTDDGRPRRSSASSGQKDSRFHAFKRKFSTKKAREHDDVQIPQNYNEITCPKCKQLYISYVSLRDDLSAADDELEAHREVVRLMQKQLELYRKQKATESDYQTSHSDRERVELLKMKDKLIVDLEHLLASTRDEKESIIHQLRNTELERNGLKEQVTMYQESLAAKDEVVMSLTHQLAELERGRDPVSVSTYKQLPVDDTLTQLMANSDRLEENERLKDMVQAYELQNKFLNQEILEQNQLRNDDQTRENILVKRCAEFEGRYYQINSKFLFLLNELNTPKLGGDENTTQEFVTQLLQDAMESEVTSKVDGLMESSRSHVEYDRYGFAKQTTWEDEDSDLVARAKRMQKKCEEINKMMQDSDVEVTIRVKWDNYLIGLGSRELQPCPELKSLIRLGIPYQHKERVWKECIELRVGQLRKQHGLGYYMDLLSSRKRTGGYNPAAKQIELDLLRTLPNNRHYESLNGEGVPKLRRILLAYSAHNPLIGYCQGLNRLAGIALLFLNEEDAFWCLVAIVDYIMPQDYYSKTLMASQADQRVLKDLISEKLPRLSAHLEQYDVDPSMFTFNWFLTVFVDNIPVETFLRIWDVFLYEGTKVLFRFAIAFFKYAEDDILSLQDHMSIHKYLRFLGEIMADPRKLCQIAFHDLNPFPMRVITNKRQFYMGQVKAELEELDAIREDFKSSQIPSERREFYSDEDND